MPKKHRTYYKEDIMGKKFGRLKPIRIVEGHRSKWVCQCDCGNLKEVYAGVLIRGQYKSCGCLEKENREMLRKKSIKHGMTETILYGKWCSMKERCYNPNYKYYNRYGGRGISVCNEWLGEHGFEAFSKWAYEMGYNDKIKGYSQSLDRKNTDGNYSPENCKWSNQLEQVRNRSNAKLIKDIDGSEITSNEFSRKHDIDADMFVYRRVIKGKSAQEILDEWNKYLYYHNGSFFNKKSAAKYYHVCEGTIDNWIKKVI